MGCGERLRSAPKSLRRSLGLYRPNKQDGRAPADAGLHSFGRLKASFPGFDLAYRIALWLAAAAGHRRNFAFLCTLHEVLEFIHGHLDAFASIKVIHRVEQGTR